MILEKGEKPEDADFLLEKAMKLHSSGEVHDDTSFDDAAMVDMAQKLEKEHKLMFSKMIEEIIEKIDSEYSQW